MTKLKNLYKAGKELKVYEVETDKLIASSYNSNKFNSITPEMDASNKLFEIIAFTGLLDHTYIRTTKPYEAIKQITN